ncbi:unnamed protein product [Arctogadus glacialis]
MRGHDVGIGVLVPTLLLAVCLHSGTLKAGQVSLSASSGTLRPDQVSLSASSGALRPGRCQSCGGAAGALDPPRGPAVVLHSASVLPSRAAILIKADPHSVLRQTGNEGLVINNMDLPDGHTPHGAKHKGLLLITSTTEQI